MKFAQILNINMVPEWRNQYLDYHGLDSALNKAIENKNMKAKEKGIDLYFELIKFDQKFANYFSRECQAQLDKINLFHKEKLSEMKGKYNNLQDQLEQVLSSAIYRDIQPDYSSQAHLDNSPETSNYNTVCSISDVFKSIRSTIGMRPDSNNQTLENGTNTLRSKYPKIAGRVSIASLFSSNNSGASSNLRLGKRRMTVMVRKFSESFSSSAHKVTNNISLPTGQPNHEQMPINLNNKIRVSPLATRLIDCNDQQPTTTTTSAKLMSREILAGATPQSKARIIASYKKKISNLKFAFRELYFNLVLFEQYTQLNHNGFEQILRKHDRMFASTLGRKFYQEYIQTADFYINLQDIDHLIESVEHIYTLHFENGNRRKAIEKLQVPTNVYRPSSPMLDFRVGYELGMFSVLFVLVLLVGFISNTDYDWRTVFRLYRSPLVLIIFLFQTGISIVIWKHYKINHVLIFELNPRNNLSFQHFIEFASLLGIIWTISVLLFLFSSHLGIRPSVCPLVVVVVIALYLFNPTQTGHYQARFWLLRILVSFFKY